MKVIPAIDIRGGRCVRLARGDFARETEFSDDPPSVARQWVKWGAELIHVVDLDGARTGRMSNLATIRQIADSGASLQVGGGIRTLEAARRLFDAGAQRVIVGTAAVENPEILRELVREFGCRVIVGVDCRGGRVAVEGWQTDTDLEARSFCGNLVDMGIERVIVTDIDRDGMLSGPNVSLLGEVLSTGVRVIASGGVGALEHLAELRDLARREPRLEGVIVGRALYDGSLAPETVLGVD